MTVLHSIQVQFQRVWAKEQCGFYPSRDYIWWCFQGIVQPMASFDVTH